MNFCSVPYEADFGGVDGNQNKMMPMAMPQANLGGGGSGGGGMPMSLPPQMNLNTQMNMPAMTTGQMSFPMPGGNLGGMPMQALPMGMLPPGAPMPMSTRLPYGSVTPLNSMTMVPMDAGGSIDAPGINAVLPDLQSMSAMPQMGQIPQMSQYNQMHQGRLMGGSAAGAPGITPSNWSIGQPHPHQMWNYPQGNYNNSPCQQHQQQLQQQHHQQQPQQQQHSHLPYQTQHHQQQQQQQQQQDQHHQHHQYQQQMQQNQRIKNPYDTLNYRDIRNGLNSPSIHDSAKFSKGNNQYNSSKTNKLVQQWR